MNYDGNSKWWTLDCEECPNRSQKFCYWGTYVKELVKSYSDGREHKAKQCEYRNQPRIGTCEIGSYIKEKKGKLPPKIIQGVLPL